MREWQADLLRAFDDDALDETALLGRIASVARTLGFEHCAYGIRVPWPVTKPRLVLLNDYPLAWQRRYHEAGYLGVDPTVRQCERSRSPVVWSDAVFASTTADFYGTKSLGLNYGVLFTAWGVAGILGPYIGARVFDATGEYRYAFFIAGGLAIVALVSLLFARAPGVVPAKAETRSAS